MRGGYEQAGMEGLVWVGKDEEEEEEWLEAKVG